MKCFLVRHHENNVDAFEPTFESTLAGAKVTVKNLHDTVRHLCKDIIVEEVDVQSDKAGLIAALNGNPIVSEPLRTWGITSRGALKEEQPDL